MGGASNPGENGSANEMLTINNANGVIMKELVIENLICELKNVPQSIHFQVPERYAEHPITNIKLLDGSLS